MNKGVNKLKAKLYLDDLTVGDVFESSQDYEITEEEIISFAKQYDPQVFHLEVEEAKETFFQGLAGSGWLTAAVSMRLTVLSLPLADGLIGAGVDLKWPSPTRAGDLLSVTITITDIRPSKSKPQQGIVSYETITKNQHGDIRQVTNARVLAFKK